jgi:hypothetical protein
MDQSPCNYSFSKKLFLHGLCIIIFLALFTRADSKTPEKAYLGLYLIMEKDITLPDSTKIKSAIRIWVQEGSPAQKAGLLNDDLIIKMDNVYLEPDHKKTLEQFKKYLTKFQPGQKISLTIFRTKPYLKIDSQGEKTVLGEEEFTDKLKEILKRNKNATLSRIDKKSIRDYTIVLGHYPNQELPSGKKIPDNSSIYPNLEDFYAPDHFLIQTLVKANHLEVDYRALQNSLAQTADFNDGFHIKAIRYILREPAKLERVTDDLTSGLEHSLSSGNPNLPEVIRLMASALDAPGSDFQSPPLRTGLTLEEHLIQLKNAMGDIHTHLAKAFAKFTEPEKNYFYDNCPSIFKALKNSFYIQESADFVKIQKIIELARKISFSELLSASHIAARFSDSNYLNALQRDLKLHLKNKKPYSVPGINGRIFHLEKTAWGDIVIGSYDDNQYRGNWAVIIDPGGNDFYSEGAGTNLNWKEPFHMIMDFKGNDIYSATGPQSAGFARMGIALVLDLKGNDLYENIQNGFGAAIAGCGILMDFAGDDIYRGKEFSHGVGLWGLGLTMDLAGNDQYQSLIFSQGVGLTKGIGLLYDRSGEDQYFATGLQPSSYGISGIFQSFSQGLGMGMRPFYSGGIGILLDTNGNDKYYAGNFSQGAGYFHGWGILFDNGKGDDFYFASRYSQGASAHSAVASFIEKGGNDTYNGVIGVSLAAAWDLSLALFVDEAGNDLYQPGGGFCLGTAAHNGWAIFRDQGGVDLYKTLSTQGNVADNSYHGGYSFAIFLDQGSSGDIYENGGGENTVKKSGEHGFFIDTDYSWDKISLPQLLKKLISNPGKGK